MDQQMLDYYRAMFPGQIAMGMGNAPSGANAQAGQANAVTKLMLALMQQRAMQKYKQQYPQQPAVPSQSQPVTTNAPGGVSDGVPGGMVGVPGQ